MHFPVLLRFSAPVDTVFFRITIPGTGTPVKKNPGRKEYKLFPPRVILNMSNLSHSHILTFFRICPLYFTVAAFGTNPVFKRDPAQRTPVDGTLRLEIAGGGIYSACEGKFHNIELAFQ